MAPASKKPKRSRTPKPRSTGPDPTLVLYVRHGQTPTTGQVLPGRAKGLHLSKEGEAQAQRVAQRIAGLTSGSPGKGGKTGKPSQGSPSVSAVYASPMERTQETAAPIARALGVRVRTRKGLIEADFGKWTGRKLRDLNKLPEWTTVQRYPSGFRFPGGESFSQMQTRMVDTVHELVAAHPGETIVITSHADTIKAAIAQALGAHLDHFQRIVIGQCSVSAVLYTTQGPVVLAVNSMGDDLSSLVPS